MGKSERLRQGRDRDALIKKRQNRLLSHLKTKLNNARDREAERFIKDMRKVRTEVPGATQEIPVVSQSDESVSLLLGKLNRDDLRKLASEHNIKGRGSMNKAELINALEAVL